MAQESIENIIKRYEKAVSNAEQYRSIHEAAYEYTFPARNTYSSKSQGSSRLNKIFDSTGMRSGQSFVNSMQSSITPPFKKWVNLKLGPGFKVLKEEESEKYKEFSQLLEWATDRGFSIINSSNFNTIVPEFYADLGVGTGIMLTLPNPYDDPVPMSFVVVPIEEIALEKGPYGNVGAVFRTNKVPARVIKDTWPDATIPSSVSRMIEEDGSQEVELIEASYTVKGQTYYDVLKKDSKERLVERVYKFNPWIVTRLNKSPLDVYGSGPFLQATPDLRTLNKAKELTMRSAQMSVFGVYTVADNDIINPNNIVLNPGTMIPVSRNGGPSGPSISPLPVAGNFNAQNFFIQDLQASVREMMFDDKLPSDVGPVRSATEIVERIKNIRKTTGAFFGPINQEFIQHLWTNILHILVDRNEIPLPKELMTVDNFFIEVEVLSPIAKEQDIEDVQNVVEAWQLYAQMAGPEAANMLFKLEGIGEYIAEKFSTPIALTYSREEREMMKAEMQAAQMAQMQMQEQAQLGQEEQQI